MALQNISYYVCLAALWLVAWLIRSPRHRQLLLLAASYLFYASWGVSLLALLIASSLANYAWGAILKKRPTAACLWSGVAANLFLLGWVRYLPAAGYGTYLHSSLWQTVGWIATPIGVSFWTFQGLSYLLDIYREKELDPSLTEFCLYMAFWPTVLSGPICRLPAMLPQLRTLRRPKWDDVCIGTHRILLGLVMKLVLARLLGAGRYPGQGADYGFDGIASGWGGIDVWMLAIAFGFQLFFDFAGYTHIAVGSARVFGLQLAENFDRPYLAETPSAFWTRWHMSLSFWIRDYFFFPLATVRREIWWRYFALVVSMVLFGLWHGARVTFLLWGLYHGILLVIHRLIQGIRRAYNIPIAPTIASLVSWGTTFALVSLGWILFRAPSVGQALTMLQTVFVPASYSRMVLHFDFYLITFLVIVGYFAYHRIERALERWREVSALRRVGRIAASVYYAAALVLIVVFSSKETIFVYTRF